MSDDSAPGLFSPRTSEDMQTRLILARRAQQNIVDSSEPDTAAILERFPLYAFYLTKQGLPFRATSVQPGPTPLLFGICTAGTRIRMLTHGIAASSVTRVATWSQHALDQIRALGSPGGAPPVICPLAASPLLL